MGNTFESDLRDTLMIRRLSSSISGRNRRIFSAGSAVPYREPGEAVPGSEGTFEAFAQEIRQELDPRGRLEHVLTNRVILSAWSLQAVAEREFAAIRSARPCEGGSGEGSFVARSHTSGFADTSPRSVFLMAHCLEKTIGLLRRLRAGAPDRWGRPAPAPDRGTTGAEPASVSDDPFESDLDFARDEDDHGRRHDHGLFDLSDEWPVGLDDRPIEGDEDAETPTGGTEETLSRRWQDRLVYDLNVSEDSPVVKGTWVTAAHVVSLVVDGWTWTDILRTHPELTVDDVRTCMAYTIALDNGEA